MSHTIPNYGATTPTALYEANYRRFIKLFDVIGDLLPEQSIELLASQIDLCILEQHKYTTVVLFTKHLASRQRPGQHGQYNKIEMELRICHDACVIEVIAYQGHKPIVSAVTYPNQQMLQIDEKKQLNLLLKEILENAVRLERQASRLTPCS